MLTAVDSLSGLSAPQSESMHVVGRPVKEQALPTFSAALCAGHNLGLSHDGTATASYYTGQGDW
jgi:hypothetical protein